MAKQAVSTASAPKVVTVPAEGKLKSLQAAAESLDATNIADLAALVRELCDALNNQANAQVCLPLLKHNELIVFMVHCDVSKPLFAMQETPAAAMVSQTTMHRTPFSFMPSQRLAKAWEACLKCGSYCLDKIDMAANKVQHMLMQYAEDTSSWTT